MNEAELISMMVMLIGMGFFYGIFIGFLKFDTIRWVKLKSTIFHKKYGILEFVSSGKGIFRVIKKLDNNIVQLPYGTFIIEQNKVYRLINNGKETNTDGKKLLPIPNLFRKKFGSKISEDAEMVLHTEIDTNKIEYEQGIPIIRFDLNDMLAKSFEAEPLKEGISRNPKQVQNILDMERTASDLEAMKMNKKKVQNLLLISLVVGIGALLFEFILWSEISSAKQGLVHISSQLEILRNATMTTIV